MSRCEAPLSNKSARLEMLLQSQSTPIRNRSSTSHFGRNSVSSRHQTSILTKQEATEMWTIAAPYASNRAPMKERALMSPSTAPLCGRANGHRGVSTRRCVHVLKPRDRPSQRPPSILLFLFLSWGPVHYNPFLAQFLRSLCKLVPGAHTTHPPRERERGH